MITWSMVFAAISAGLVGGFHCVGMCGGISHMLNSAILDPANSSADNRKYANATVIPIQTVAPPRSTTTIAYLHLGRLTTYAIIGGVFGVVGTLALRLNFASVHQVLYVLGNSFLLLLGLRLLGVQLGLPSPILHFIQKIYPFAQVGWRGARQHPFLTGLAWGALPCGLSFVVAPFAILSGAAWSGAVLMVVFGLAALPHLLLTQALSRRWSDAAAFRLTRIVCGAAMLMLAMLGLFYWDMQSMPAFLCVSPKPI